MNILFVGDIFGSAGRKIVREHIGHIREAHAVDLTVINAENAAGGFGVTPQIADDLFDLGADVLTTGNHVWDKRELLEYLASVACGQPGAPAARAAAGEPARRDCRAMAYTKGRPQTAFPYAVINLMGRVFMNGNQRSVPRRQRSCSRDITAKVILVDFHAEATSEKVAMGWHLDGRVTAVLGTHTHIPTADERVLPGGTAYQTDVGMSGPYDSVIGVEKELVLHRFLTGMPGKFEAAKGNPKMCAALVTCDPHDGAGHQHSAHHAGRVKRPAQMTGGGFAAGLS